MSIVNIITDKYFVPNPEKTLALDSAAGNQIDNGQLFEISSFEMNQEASLNEKYEGTVTFRSKSTPRYNCHGMTFASRRTGIYDTQTINQILKEDGYKEIDPASVLPGDVIVYYAADGDAEHSGVVISEIDSQLRIPKVVSKWGKFAEFVHWANQCPYTFVNAKFYRVSA
jgi:hypothetical protein